MIKLGTTTINMGNNVTKVTLGSTIVWELNTPTMDLTYFNTASGDLLFETDDIIEMADFLSVNQPTAPSTISFNSSMTKQITQKLVLINNSNHLLKVKKADDSFDVIVDVQNLDNTVLQLVGKNFELDGLTLMNADPVGDFNSGAILRIDSLSGSTLKNLKLYHGFCGLRGTLNIVNVTADTIEFREVVEGSIRMGDGLNSGIDGQWDMRNINIRNLTFTDNLSGGTISGTTKKFRPFLLLKKADMLLVENILLTDTIYSSIGDVESTNNLIFRNIICNQKAVNGIQVFSSSGIEVSNYFFRPNGVDVSTGLYITLSDEIKLYYNTLLQARVEDSACVLYLVKTIAKVRANIFQCSYNSTGLNIQFEAGSYTATIGTDLLDFNNNVYIGNSTGQYYLTILALSDFNSGGYTRIFDFGDYTVPVWKGTYLKDINSQFSTDSANLVFEADGLHLQTGSPFGKNAIASQIDSITTDATNTLRTYPTDTGAFN